MEALRKLYENLGYQHVKTYLQSGNVVFKAPASENEIAQKISRRIKTEYGFEVPVIVLTLDELEKIIESNPFLNDPEKDPSAFYVTFLETQPAIFDRKVIEDKKRKEEEIHFADNAVYIYCPKGYGATKLSNTFLESKLKVSATTRNWKSTNAIFKLAQQLN